VQFGANLWIWDSPVDLQVVERRAPALKSWGFDLVELPLEMPTSWSPAAVRRVLDDHGLSASVCVAMSPERSLTAPDAQTVRRTQDYLFRAIEAAAVVGSPIIAGPIYSPTGLTGMISAEGRSEILGRLADNLQPVIKPASATGICLAIEPLNRFETSLFNTAEQTMALVKAVDTPHLGILLDVFHMNIEERDMAEAIHTAGRHLVHFHACGNDRGTPGNGAIPWLAVAAALRAVHYDGSIVIESFTGSNQVLAAAAAIWRPLAASQDAIAVDGLAFLQNILD
jgi:D-psicose/D-tagatose/L-ribulose 3-epimerase